jgi:hypothetical protein
MLALLSRGQSALIAQSGTKMFFVPLFQIVLAAHRW